MENFARKHQPRKDYGLMDRGISFLDAAMQMNLYQVKTCLAENPDCIHDTDEHENNVMHLCVLGGAAIRAREMMIFFLRETSINLLHKNSRGLDPLELAFVQNAREAIDLIEDPWHSQLDARYPIAEDRPKLTLVQGGKAPKFPGPGSC